MRAIETCRTADRGGHVEKCSQCEHLRISYNSCRNRHCPKCQGKERAQWLQQRQAELLPIEYFHVVFTLPAPLAALAYRNKTVVYDILFRAGAETLLTIARDPKHLGAEIGFFGILHTWGQNLHHHPHVHCVVSGGGPSADSDRFVRTRPGFFLPVRVCYPASSAGCSSKLYRRPSSKGTSSFSPISSTSTMPSPSPNTSSRCRTPIGSCTPSRPSPDLKPCWPI
jgi:hypothetical protein